MKHLLLFLVLLSGCFSIQSPGDDLDTGTTFNELTCILTVENRLALERPITEVFWVDPNGEDTGVSRLTIPMLYTGYTCWFDKPAGFYDIDVVDSQGDMYSVEGVFCSPGGEGRWVAEGD